MSRGAAAPEPPTPRRQARVLLLGVIGSVAVWGLYLSIGAWQGDRTRSPDLVRGLFVAVCFAGFLGLWLIGLRLKARDRTRALHEQPHEQPVERVPDAGESD